MSTFAGTGRLIRLGIRRDRITLAAWVVGLAGLAYLTVSAMVGLAPTEADRVVTATFSAGNRLARAFDGPASGTDLGAMTMVEVYGVLAVLAGLMSIMIMTRLTRQDEETGRAELLGSAVVGRRARLTAAVAVAALANLIVAIATTIALLLQDLGWEGSILSGCVVGAAGMSFAAIAAVTSQLVDSQRAATGWASAALGAAFLIRAIGDAAGRVDGETFVVSAWPSWLSPIGWGQQARPFSQNQWDVMILFAVFILVHLVVATVISDRRDLAAGVFRVRPGPPSAPGTLSTPWRLLWRLQWGTALGWTVGVLILAVAWASLGDGADELVGLSEEFEAMFRAMVGEGEMVDAYVAFVMSFTAIVIGAAMIQSLLRARTEEVSGRVEAVLAGSIGRHRWMGAVIAVAAGITIGIMVAAGIISAIVYGVMIDDIGEGIRSFGGATLAQLPALIALGGAVVALIGLIPKWSLAAAWALLAVSFVVGQLGSILDLPQMALNLSPFTHVPAFPAEGFAVLPMVLLCVVGVLLGGFGLRAFGRRDLDL